MYKCPTCGAGLVFDPKTQKLQCLSCRNQYDSESVENIKLDTAKETESSILNTQEDYEAISYKCSHCGAELITTDETITTFCSFCRTGTMLDRKIVKKKKPDYVIPFKLTKKDCEQIYINKIKKSIFAPKNMIDTQEVEKIRGIYMPYWIYSFEKHGSNSDTGSKYSHRSGDYVYYDDYTLTTNIDARCNGITHDATSNFSDRLSESIAPFSVKEKKEFSPAYLSGYYADNEDVDNKIYESENNEIASKHISKKLGKEKEYHKYGAKPKVMLDNKSTELALFPVYFLATKNKRGDRISYAVINGQNGKIAADIPIDFKKFGIFSLLLSIPIFLILNMFFTISMPSLVVLSILFNIISLILLYNQNKKIKNRENQLDDKGAQFKENKGSIKEEKPKKKKINMDLLIILSSVFVIFAVPFLILLCMEYPILPKLVGYFVLAIISIFMVIRILKNPEKDISIYKPTCGLLITLLVFCLKPASDIYYYSAAIFSIAMSIWAFYNIVEKYNILTTRKLPQLGKRGGDENA